MNPPASMRAWCSELSLGSLFRPASKDSHHPRKKNQQQGAWFDGPRRRHSPAALYRRGTRFPLPSPPQPSHRPSPTHFAPSIRPKTDPALLPTTRSACPSHTLQHHPRTRSRTPDQRSTRRPGIADRVLLITRGFFRRREDGDAPTTLLWPRTRSRAR